MRESFLDRAARTLPPAPRLGRTAEAQSAKTGRIRGTRAQRARAAIVGAICLALLTVSYAQDRSMNLLAEQYVRLVLAVGQHDADYVDAYYGPPEWRTEAEAQKLSLSEIASRASRARLDADGDETHFRRGVESTLRRVTADAYGSGFRRSAETARFATAGQGFTGRPLRCISQRIRDSARAARCGVQSGDRRLPQPHAAAHHAATGRKFHRGICDGEEL